MMDLLGDLKPSDAEFAKPLFTKGDQVKFVVKDFKVKEDNGALTLRTEIQSGEHSGKSYTIFIPAPENDIKRKQRAAFFFKSGAWSEAEIAARDVKLARLMGAVLQGEATAVRAGKEEGVNFQDIINLKYLGQVDLNTAAAGQTPAGVAAGQTSF